MSFSFLFSGRKNCCKRYLIFLIIRVDFKNCVGFSIVQYDLEMTVISVFFSNLSFLRSTASQKNFFKLFPLLLSHLCKKFGFNKFSYPSVSPSSFKYLTPRWTIPLFRSLLILIRFFRLKTQETVTRSSCFIVVYSNKLHFNYLFYLKQITKYENS